MLQASRVLLSINTHCVVHTEEGNKLGGGERRHTACLHKPTLREAITYIVKQAQHVTFESQLYSVNSAQYVWFLVGFYQYILPGVLCAHFLPLYLCKFSHILQRVQLSSLVLLVRQPHCLFRKAHAE